MVYIPSESHDIKQNQNTDWYVIFLSGDIILKYKNNAVS